MTLSEQPLPIVRPLPEDFSMVEAFARLHRRPGCLWLDSASSDLVRTPPVGDIGRHSFLTSDPIETLTATLDDANPWPQLDRWCRSLPPEHSPALPPFQGGVAGLIGYEAACWLEPIGAARHNDLPTPAMSLGLYDWTIASDHRSGKAWLISQGLGAAGPRTRIQAAIDRADEIESLLLGSPTVADATRLPDGTRLSDRAARTIHSPRSQQPVSAAQGWSGDGPEVTSNFTSEAFRAGVAEIVRRIHDGDSFQVNLAQRLLRKADLPAAELYLRLRDANPAPFGAFYGGDDFAVLSSSPEGFLNVRRGRVETRPIKGTIPRTGDDRRDRQLAEQLSASEKDRAENIMIVDLMRNDLSRVCEDDSVVVEQLCEIERYEFVQHLVSVIRGQLCKDTSVADLLMACFPGGSVTGAPKIEAMRTIASLEPHRRGPYCGSLGYIGCGGNADFNILIRTITAAHGHWQIPVGGGITARSDPEAEEAETWAKAKGMLRAMP